MGRVLAEDDDVNVYPITQNSTHSTHSPPHFGQSRSEVLGHLLQSYNPRVELTVVQLRHRFDAILNYGVLPLKVLVRLVRLKA